MIKTGSLTRNSIYNLLGQGLPMLVGIITIPRLVHALGVDRFGVLTLAWAVMGYFSLFDLGLGRALTQLVSERSGTKDDHDLPDIIWTALLLMLALGLMGGLFLGVASQLVVGRLLKMSPTLHREVLYAFGLMALSIPVITVLAGLRGLLEARRHFLEINLLRVGMGIITFLGPWLVSFWTTHLFWVVMSLEIMRYAALGVHYWVCRRVVPEMTAGGAFRLAYWKVLIRFGGWMTVSNIISPLMVNLDRLFIGTFVSLGAIAYYATPFDMVTKVLTISGAVVSVLFPMFGALHRLNPVEARRLYDKGLKTLLLVLAPVLLVLGLASNWILFHWLGQDFARQSSGIMRILCLGVLINAIASVPFAFIQGAARPDLTAKFHLVEAPIYLIILWILGSHLGIMGVAWAWVIRVTLDLVLLLLVAQRLQKIELSKHEVRLPC